MNVNEIKVKVQKNGSFGKDKSNFKLKKQIPFFKKEIEILIYNIRNQDNDDDWKLTQEIIEGLLKFPESNKVWMKNEMWKHYEACIEETDYGMVDYGDYENHKKSNLDYFKIYNPDDAFENAKLEYISFEVDFKLNYFLLYFKCPWDDEHGMTIEVKNGHFASIQ